MQTLNDSNCILFGVVLRLLRYVSLKEKAARKCGILTDQVRLPASASEAEVRIACIWPSEVIISHLCAFSLRAAML